MPRSAADRMGIANTLRAHAIRMAHRSRGADLGSCLVASASQRVWQ
jgi:hypothetical protein